MSQFYCTYEVKEEDLVFEMGGSLLVNHIDYFYSEINEAFNKIKKSMRLILLMEDVDYIDSSGVGALMHVMKMCEEESIEAYLKNPSAGVLKILKITKVDHFFKFL